jgi:hypothetical protein
VRRIVDRNMGEHPWRFIVSLGECKQKSNAKVLLEKKINKEKNGVQTKNRND